MAPALAELGLVHHAAGETHRSRTIVDHALRLADRSSLPDTVEGCAVQYPGRQDRCSEPCAGSIHVLTGTVHGMLLEHSSAPVELFGHSMGSVVAFEVARRMAEAAPGLLLGLADSG